MNLEDVGHDLQRLIDAHPHLFCGKAPAVHSYVTAGWYGLLDKLCRDLESLLGPESCAAFSVIQIKEKFGTLRFYYRFGEEEDLHVDLLSPEGRVHLVCGRGEPASGEDLQTRIRELVGQACAASETACEQCGALGQLRNLGGYLVTLCDPHLAERSARKDQE